MVVSSQSADPRPATHDSPLYAHPSVWLVAAKPPACELALAALVRNAPESVLDRTWIRPRTLVVAPLASAPLADTAGAPGVRP